MPRWTTMAALTAVITSLTCRCSTFPMISTALTGWRFFLNHALQMGNAWYCGDDSRVSPKSGPPVDPSSYILFYRRTAGPMWSEHGVLYFATGCNIFKCTYIFFSIQRGKVCCDGLVVLLVVCKARLYIQTHHHIFLTSRVFSSICLANAVDERGSNIEPSQWPKENEFFLKELRHNYISVQPPQVTLSIF